MMTLDRRGKPGAVERLELTDEDTGLDVVCLRRGVISACASALGVTAAVRDDEPTWEDVPTGAPGSVIRLAWDEHFRLLEIATRGAMRGVA